MPLLVSAGESFACRSEAGANRSRRTRRRRGRRYGHGRTSPAAPSSGCRSPRRARCTCRARAAVGRTLRSGARDLRLHRSQPTRGRGRGAAGLPLGASRATRRNGAARLGGVAGDDGTPRKLDARQPPNRCAASRRATGPRARGSPGHGCTAGRACRGLEYHRGPAAHAARGVVTSRGSRASLRGACRRSAPQPRIVRSLLSRARRTLRMQLERGAAALIGPQWLSLFARLFTDNNPALSSAARTAAVGFGALAITSCAVVAPTLTRHPHGHATAPAARSTAAAQRAAASSRTIDATASRSQTAAVEESGFVTSGRRDSVRFDSHDSTVGTNDRRHRRERGRTSADLRGRSGGDPVEGIPSSRVGLDGGGSTDGSGGSTSGRDSTGGGSPAGSSGPADGGSAPSGSASGGDGDRGGSSGGRTEGPSGSADTTSGGSIVFGSLGSGRSLSAAGATGTSGGETSGDGAGSSPGPGSEGSASEPSTIVTSSQGSDGGGGTSSSDGYGSSSGSGGSAGSSGSDGSGGSGAPGGGS